MTTSARNIKAITSRIEAEYSRGWIEANPELFAASMLKLTDQAREEGYTITAEAASRHRLTIRLDLIGDKNHHHPQQETRPMNRYAPSFTLKADARFICLRNIDGGLFMVDPADRDEMKACIEIWTSYMTFAMRNGNFAGVAVHANNIAKLAAELEASK